MSEFNPEQILEPVFSRLRKNGFNLGISEYLAAVDAVRGGMGADSLDALRLILLLLWCHSIAEQSQFAVMWEAISADFSPAPLRETTQQQKDETPLPDPPKPLEQLPPPLPELPPPEQDLAPTLTPLPVRSPYVPIDIDNTPDLHVYLPVSRRSMAYIWRYLRRPVADGPADVLDIELTVEQAARQGFFLAPVYRRREVNHAQLLLLIDQDGSMTPFHRFTRDLVETVQEEGKLERVAIYYFHNVPDDYVYQDARLTQPVPLEAVIAGCDADTSLLVVSDAGAARGYRRMERIRATTEFLVQLKQRTNLIGWLNPMPVDRWQATSAEVIAYLVRMQQMDEDGFGNVIDIVRGQPLAHLHED
ncbi:VWA containing CoxE family protein [Kovacikia minuta CCNUW1]|uniref:VWA containing CoxE family protein n=1 Tax=Kovacikia minuta TaxID=2931930 RepID=UPI001CCE5468|nr:VWA containing CoxE family protein [Kovacikia minuta]UBF27481.1 VWA containing CoxE family protein [Kovacikia minuta CCNUW1]